MRTHVLGRKGLRSAKRRGRNSESKREAAWDGAGVQALEAVGRVEEYLAEYFVSI